MKLLLLVVIVITTVAACACKRSGTQSTWSGHLLFRVDDLGGSAPDSITGGPVLAIWTDGIVAISENFPSYSPEFQLGRFDGQIISSLEDQLGRFLLDIPDEMAFAVDEWKARAMLRSSGDGLAPTTTRDLPMCFLNASCSERLGSLQRTRWAAVRGEIQKAVDAGERPNGNAIRRARELWRNEKPGDL
jgi:hypothetical protein